MARIYSADIGEGPTNFPVIKTRQVNGCVLSWVSWLTGESVLGEREIIQPAAIRSWGLAFRFA
jgi:hypothetical protein